MIWEGIWVQLLLSAATPTRRFAEFAQPTSFEARSNEPDLTQAQVVFLVQQGDRVSEDKDPYLSLVRRACARWACRSS